LKDHEIDISTASYSPAGNWIRLDVPVRIANQLLGCKYSVFQHKGEGVRLVRTPEWSLPKYLHDHVELIEPTNSFMRPMKKSPRSTVKFNSYVGAEHVDFSYGTDPTAAPNDSSISAVCNSTLVTPNCLRTLYGTVNYTAKAENNRMAIANYLNEVNLRSDLKIYLQNYRKDIPPSQSDAFGQISIDNGTLQQTPLNSSQIAAQTGVEGNLDVQTMVGIAYPIPLTSYSTGGMQPGFMPDNYTKTNTNEPYLAWVNYISALDDKTIPYVVSTSYADDEQVRWPPLSTKSPLADHHRLSPKNTQQPFVTHLQLSVHEEYLYFSVAAMRAWELMGHASPIVHLTSEHSCRHFHQPAPM
jgi:tripeptidyl-peptidase-1